MAAITRRPFGVSFLSILLMIIGVLQIGSGVAAIAERNNDEFLDALDSSSGDVTAVAVVAIIMGVVTIAVAVALRGGANWARLAIAIIAAINLVNLVWSAATYHQVHWYNVAWPAIIDALIAGYLFFDDDAKAYFTRAIRGSAT